MEDSAGRPGAWVDIARDWFIHWWLDRLLRRFLNLVASGN
jgi:hypothetical protein